MDKELMNVFNDLERRGIVDRGDACIKNNSKKEVEVELQFSIRDRLNPFLEGSIDLPAVTIGLVQLDIVFVFNLKKLDKQGFFLLI